MRSDYRTAARRRVFRCCELGDLRWDVGNDRRAPSLMDHDERTGFASGQVLADHVATVPIDVRKSGTNARGGRQATIICRHALCTLLSEPARIGSASCLGFLIGAQAKTPRRLAGRRRSVDVSRYCDGTRSAREPRRLQSRPVRRRLAPGSSGRRA